MITIVQILRCVAGPHTLFTHMRSHDRIARITYNLEIVIHGQIQSLLETLLQSQKHTLKASEIYFPLDSLILVSYGSYQANSSD